MLSFLMGKRKKRGERSRMGNNHSKIEETGQMGATSRAGNEETTLSKEEEGPEVITSSVAFNDHEELNSKKLDEPSNPSSRVEYNELVENPPSLGILSTCSSELTAHINHALNTKSQEINEAEVNSTPNDVKNATDQDCGTKTTSQEGRSSELISTGNESPVTDQQREQELRITCVHSIDCDPNEPRSVTESHVAATPQLSPCGIESSSTALRDLEKSRKAFFKGLLGETVEEIYPEDVKIVETLPVTRGKSESKSGVKEIVCPPLVPCLETPVCPIEHNDEISQLSSGVYFAQNAEIASIEDYKGETDPTSGSSDGKYGSDDLTVGMDNGTDKFSDGAISQLHDVDEILEDFSKSTSFTSQSLELCKVDQEDSIRTKRSCDIYDRSDEPGEERSDSDCDDEEAEFIGDAISLIETSVTNNSDEKVTDSGFGNDDNPEFDEVLHTELDEISLDEFDTLGCEQGENISIDLVITEMKCEEVAVASEPEVSGDKQEIELENNSADLGQRENDVKVDKLRANYVETGEGESESDDRTREGLGNSLPGEQEGGLPAGPVHCAIPRDEHQVDMLTVRNGAYETFPRSNLSLSSSSDESIGNKVKKHVRWADTDEGRSLESYDSYSSSEEESGSEDEGVAVDQEIESAKTEPADRDEDDEGDEGENESSESDEESDSDVEENKTGADDTFTESDISVINVEPVQENKDVEDDDEDEEDEDDDDEEDEEYKKKADEETDSKTEESLVDEITRLQEELLSKAVSLERAQSELDAAVLESDKNRKKIERLQEELSTLKRRNAELQRDSNERSVSSDVQERLECRIKELEDELEALRNDRNRLRDRLSMLESERDHEIRMVQQALEEALREQAAREARYQKEFESERTLSSQRELQMLEDFEWKLRETEKNAKKKVENAEAESTKRVQDMEARLARAEADLERLAELKLCEIELKQLKVTSLEQRRNLRQITRQFEELQVNEKILQEEVYRLRAALDKEKQTVASMQVLHKEELAEKERKLRVKLDVQSSQLTSEWEDRLRRELAKLKTEMENTHREEKIVAVDMAKLIKEQEINALKQGWEKKSKEFKSEVANYKEKLEEKESQYRLEIENAQTSSDRDTLDLRRKMDKLDMEYQSKIEKMQEEHEAELNEVKHECERKMAQLEASHQLQSGTTRTTIELVKQQMMNENQARIERMQALHRQQMEEQWEMMEMERRKEVRTLEDCHRAALEQLRKELDEIRKAVTPNTAKQNSRQRTPMPETAKQLVIDQLNHEATNPFSCGDLDEIEAVSTGSDAEKILFAKLQQMARQAREDQMEIEKLRQCLEERESSAPQGTKQTPQTHQPSRQQQHPPHPTRRNRKRRN